MRRGGTAIGRIDPAGDRRLLPVELAAERVCTVDLEGYVDRTGHTKRPMTVWHPRHRRARNTRPMVTDDRRDWNPGIHGFGSPGVFAK